MVNGRSLLIRADASTRLGTGHAMRCFALAKAWQRTGAAVRFAMAESLPGMPERFNDSGIEVETIEGDAGSETDARKTMHLARRLDSQWAVVDGYQFAPDYLRELKSSGLSVAMFDDDGRFAEYCADVVVNQNLGAVEAMYHGRASYTKLLLGSDYALLRPEFLNASSPRANPTIARRLLVTMGGSDAENVSAAVIEALAGIGDTFQTTVVIGPGNSNLAQLRALTAKHVAMRLEINPADMATLMRRADIAISAAGSTCWELAYLGVPMILVVQADNQRMSADELARRGAAINLGWYSDVSHIDIASAVQELAGDVSRRREMSQAGRRLVDGRGAERVVSILQGAS